ncbi:MAG: MBG domain-containing protein [Clostridia bacterium]|nr:MBG domain-containing protein [Clostridia bacterium]
MKKLLAFLLSAVMTVTAGVTLGACGGSEDGKTDGNEQQQPEQGLKTFTGISLADKTVTYNGQAQSLAISGVLPEGATVDYTGNGKTDAGEYTVTAAVYKNGYKTLNLAANLKIVKAQFTGITFEDKEFIADKQPHKIEVAGTLPQGTSVTYENNNKTDAGVYEVKATLTNKNYETLTLTATLTIKTKVQVAVDTAKNIVNALVNKPDPWSFMPEALKLENMAYANMPATDFTSFVNSGAIGTKAIGKQMNVLYDSLGYAATALGYVDKVTAVGTTIADLYQSYINKNPDNYKEFSGEAGGFKFKITLDGEHSKLLAGNSTVSIELGYDGETGERTGRIQITGGVALKYGYSENRLKLAIKATINGVGELRQIEFVRSGSAVTGYMYEYLGTENTALKTSAVISSNAVKTVIMSNKRESDDLIINGYEEVYDSLTGKFLGGEVQETVKTADYDTLWFMLGDVSGFNSVKVQDVKNGMNADTVYVNGGSASFEVVRNKIAMVETSRKFDIEMKDVWYVQAVTENGEVKYDKVKAEIPMIFVQKSDAANFGSMVLEKNPNEFTTAPVISAANKSKIEADYSSIQTTFNAIKTQVTYSEIDGYVGTADSYFSN